MDGSTSSSVSSDRTITAGRIQGAAGSRGGQSWGEGRDDRGDNINDVEAAAVAIKTTPPPAYATLSASSGSGSGTGFAYVAPAHAEFGPTPLTGQHPLLAVPYHAYEYIGSPGAPDRRARWRFAGGLVWAVVVVWGMGVLGWVALGGQ